MRGLNGGLEKELVSSFDYLEILITQFGVQLLGAVLILIIGWFTAKWLSNLAYRALKRAPRHDETLSQFVRSLVRYSIIAFTITAVLSKFGVQTTSLVAVIGAAGIAIGLALQGTLSHLASGVMILIFRPFNIGDYVDAGGISGTVKSISLFTTEFATSDNIRIIVPNGNIWGQSVKNYSVNRVRRLELSFTLSYHEDTNQALALLMETVQAEKRILKSPAPMTAISQLGDNSVTIMARAWTATSDFWDVTFALNKSVKDAFDAQAINLNSPTNALFLGQVPTLKGSPTPEKKALEKTKGRAGKKASTS